MKSVKETRHDPDKHQHYYRGLQQRSAELSVLFSEWANATEVEISDSGEISYTLSRGGYGWQTATDEQLAAFVGWVEQ
jgi:hypothetical protein